MIGYDIITAVAPFPAAADARGVLPKTAGAAKRRAGAFGAERGGVPAAIFRLRLHRGRIGAMSDAPAPFV
jgi:hypothetical protein